MRVGYLVRHSKLHEDNEWDEDNEWTFVDGLQIPHYYSESKMIVYDFVENPDD
jgi:hypothetical protein